VGAVWQSAAQLEDDLRCKFENTILKKVSAAQAGGTVCTKAEMFNNLTSKTRDMPNAREVFDCALANLVKRNLVRLQKVRYTVAVVPCLPPV